MTQTTARIGIVGVGNMGMGIALRLRELGLAVTVRDIDPAREALAEAAGCRRAATPAALAARSDLVVVVVVDGRQTHDVLFGRDGAAETLAAGSAVLLCPTIAPHDVEACAARLAPRGVDAVDAPMSGGPARARAGRMSLMVGCDDELEAWDIQERRDEIRLNLPKEGVFGRLRHSA